MLMSSLQLLKMSSRRWPSLSGCLRAGPLRALPPACHAGRPRSLRRAQTGRKGSNVSQIRCQLSLDGEETGIC